MGPPGVWGGPIIGTHIHTVTQKNTYTHTHTHTHSHIENTHTHTHISKVVCITVQRAGVRVQS